MAEPANRGSCKGRIVPRQRSFVVYDRDVLEVTAEEGTYERT
jgi:hypothetical protein